MIDAYLVFFAFCFDIINEFQTLAFSPKGEADKKDFEYNSVATLSRIHRHYLMGHGIEVALQLLFTKFWELSLRLRVRLVGI